MYLEGRPFVLIYEIMLKERSALGHRAIYLNVVAVQNWNHRTGTRFPYMQ